MTSVIKSIAPVEIPGKGWDVRIRYTDGRPAAYLCNKTGPYTLAQAQAAAQNASRLASA